MYKIAGLQDNTLGAKIDVGTVTVKEGSGVLDLEVTDPNISRTVQRNIFNVDSGLLANAYQILTGFAQLKFDNTGGVTGSFDFVGSGQIEPGSCRIKATLTGNK